MDFTLNDIDLQMALTFQQALVEYKYVVNWYKFDILFIWPWSWSNDLGTQT